MVMRQRIAFDAVSHFGLIVFKKHRVLQNFLHRVGQDDRGRVPARNNAPGWETEDVRRTPTFLRCTHFPSTADETRDKTRAVVSILADSGTKDMN